MEGPVRLAARYRARGFLRLLAVFRLAHRARGAARRVVRDDLVDHERDLLPRGEVEPVYPQKGANMRSPGVTVRNDM